MRHDMWCSERSLWLDMNAKMIVVFLWAGRQDAKAAVWLSSARRKLPHESYARCIAEWSSLMPFSRFSRCIAEWSSLMPSPPPTLLLPSNETSARARLRKIRSNCWPMTQGVRCWTYSCPPENLRGPWVVLDACSRAPSSSQVARLRADCSGRRTPLFWRALERGFRTLLHACGGLAAFCELQGGQGKACDQPAISDDACCLLSRACPWASALCTPRCGQASLGEK